MAQHVPPIVLYSIAMGYTEDEIKRPLIGVVNAQTKLFPGTSILT
jgi:dihydroxyacid dehydratase/phosphogluconate dehydratase